MFCELWTEGRKKKEKKNVFEEEREERRIERPTLNDLNALLLSREERMDVKFRSK